MRSSAAHLGIFLALSALSHLSIVVAIPASDPGEGSRNAITCHDESCARRGTAYLQTQRGLVSPNSLTARSSRSSGLDESLSANDHQSVACARDCGRLEHAVAHLLNESLSHPPACENFCTGSGCNCQVPWEDRCKIVSCAACSECDDVATPTPTAPTRRRRSPTPTPTATTTTTTTTTAPAIYEEHPKRIGCHANGANLGYLGKPKDFLANYGSNCASGGSECVDKGKEACDYLNSQGTTCVGFALNIGWGVQIFGPLAIDTSQCNSDDGLTTNDDWTTYLLQAPTRRRRSPTPTPTAPTRRRRSTTSTVKCEDKGKGDPVNPGVFDQCYRCGNVEMDSDVDGDVKKQKYTQQIGGTSNNCYVDYKQASADCAATCNAWSQGDDKKCIGIQVQSQSDKDGNPFSEITCPSDRPQHWQCEIFTDKKGGIFERYRDRYPARSSLYYFANRCCTEIMENGVASADCGDPAGSEVYAPCKSGTERCVNSKGNAKCKPKGDKWCN